MSSESTPLEHIATLAAEAWEHYRTSPRDEFESFLEMLSAEAAAAISSDAASIHIGSRRFVLGRFYRPARPTPGMGPVQFLGIRAGRVVYRQRGKLADRTCAVDFWPEWVGEEASS